MVKVTDYRHCIREGYSRKVHGLLISDYGTIFQLSTSVNIFTGPHKGRPKLMNSINKCIVMELLEKSPIQDILNTTIATDILAFPFKEWQNTTWFMRFIAMETFQQIPLEIITTRGEFNQSRLDTLQNIIASVDVEEVSSFDFCMYPAMKLIVWIPLIVTVFLHAFVKAKIFLKLWIFFCRFLKYRVK